MQSWIAGETDAGGAYKRIALDLLFPSVIYYKS